MSEHTSGPWIFHPEDGRAPDGYLPIFGPVKGKDGFTFYPRIASVGALGGPPADNDPDGDYRARDEANARLIAAAPELLAALQGLVEDVLLPHQYEEAKSARAALAKALGQEAVSQ